MVSEVVPSLADIWHTPLQIFEPFTIGFAVGDVPDGAPRIRSFDNPLCQLPDTDFVSAAEVEYLSVGSAIIQACNNAVNHIIHMTKTAGLLAIPKNGERLFPKSLMNQRGYDHSVMTCLPGPRCIKETNNTHGKIALSIIGERQKFIDSFGTSVAPPRIIR
jgi:hypothetical protein